MRDPGQFINSRDQDFPEYRYFTNIYSIYIYIYIHNDIINVNINKNDSISLNF